MGLVGTLRSLSYFFLRKGYSHFVYISIEPEFKTWSLPWCTVPLSLPFSTQPFYVCYLIGDVTLTGLLINTPFLSVPFTAPTLIVTTTTLRSVPLPLRPIPSPPHDH